MKKCYLLGALICAFTLFTGTAQAANKLAVTVGIGGRSFIAYLPITLGEQLGFFKAAGLNEKSVDFKGGSKSLAALIGGSVDVVMGYYDHTVEMAAKGRHIRAVVEVNRFPGIVLAASSKLKNVHSPADLKGKVVGVTALGSSTNFFLNYVLSQNGLAPDAVTTIGVGANSTAVAALEHGQVDALVNLDPAISLMKKRGDIKILVDTRTKADSQKLYGGAYPGATLYAKQSYISAHPKVIQKLVDGMVRTLKWMHTHSAADIVKHVPPEYYAGTGKAMYTQMLADSLEMFSPNGHFEVSGPKNVMKVLSMSSKEVADAHLNLSATYTNQFVDKSDH